MTSRQPRTTTTPTTTTTQALLARAHSPASAERIYTEKIQHRTIFLRPTSPPPQATAKQARRRERERRAQESRRSLRPRPLSAKQRKKLGLYDVPRDGAQRYATFVPLHHLWLGYVREVLGGEVYTGGQGAAAKLSAADFHGAEVEVVRSGCVGRVGIRGIVIRDTRSVFEVITPKNKIKIVPKEGTMFKVEVPPPPPPPPPSRSDEDQDDQKAPAPAKNLVFEILGDQFAVRAADRANRKFKPHFLKNI